MGRGGLSFSVSAAARNSDLSVLVNIPVGRVTQTSFTAAPFDRTCRTEPCQSVKLSLLLVYFAFNLAYFSGLVKVYFDTALAVALGQAVYIPHCSSK